MKRVLLLTIKSLTFIAFLSCLLMILGTLMAIVEGYTSYDMPLVKKAAIKYGENYYSFADSFYFPLSWVIPLIWITIGFYAFYFWKLKDFFTSFYDSQTFSDKSIKNTKTFLWLNILPVIAAICFFCYGTIVKGKDFDFGEDMMYILIHGFIFLLVYFYLDNAKKGNVLKSENDLTI